MRYRKILIGVALVGSLFWCGCEPQASNQMTVGKVDTAALLQDDADYQSMSIEYIKQQTDIRRDLVEKMRAAGDDQAKIKKLQQEFVKKQKDFDEVWKKKTDDFLAKRHDAISNTAATIAKRKKIDLVLIDSKMYPTVEWGGADMTKDMSLAMSAGSQSTKPSSTSTPSGE